MILVFQINFIRIHQSWFVSILPVVKCMLWQDHLHQEAQRNHMVIFFITLLFTFHKKSVLEKLNCHYIDDIRFCQQMNGFFLLQNWLPWIQNTLIRNSSMPILPTFLLQIFQHPWLRLQAAMPMPPSPRSRACPRSCQTGRVFPSLVPLLTIHR